jgi:hypothetical protein
MPLACNGGHFDVAITFGGDRFRKRLSHENAGMEGSEAQGVAGRARAHQALAKYVRALGGDVEIRAVFPEATFNLEPLLTGEIVPTPASVSISSKRRAVGQKSLGGRRRVAAVVS